MLQLLHKNALLLLICTVAVLAHGQEISEKEDLAVFSLSHYQWQIPGGALSLVDEQIKEVFVGLRRFNVIGLSYRLDSEGVDQFIEKIREVKEKNIDLPETVRLGQEAFTEADFDTLVNSFIVVVPVMTRYELQRVSQEVFEARIEVTFSFIDVAEAEAFGYFSLAVDARADSGRAAVQRAADEIAPNLVFEIRQLSQFQLKTGIIEIRGRQVFLEFGADMGVMVGDEYAIVTDTVLPSGHVISEETGLMIVNDVKEKISIAALIYSEAPPRIGDQLREVPRYGLDTGVHARTVITSDGAVGIIGVRQSISRGFFTYRPIVGIDIPISLYGTTDLGLIFNIYGGGEINWYLWRFQLAPTAALGLGGSIPTTGAGTFSVSHFGGFVELVASYLLNRDLRLAATVGFSAWFGLSDASGDSYFGPLFGIGAIYKY